MQLPAKQKITTVKTFMDACKVYLVHNTAVILRVSVSQHQCQYCQSGHRSHPGHLCSEQCLLSQLIVASIQCHCSNNFLIFSTIFSHLFSVSSLTLLLLQISSGHPETEKYFDRKYLQLLLWRHQTICYDYCHSNTQ